MPIFVPPRLAGSADIVGVGGPLTAETLAAAYAQGIFPWPIPDYPLLWFSPSQRAVLDFDRLHLTKSLRRARTRSALTFTRNCAFASTTLACQKSPRPGQESTWITPPMRAAYQALHHLGQAHSVEAWDEAGTLVGGLYGVGVGGYFSGESMFHLAPNASKLALLFLIDYLAERGLRWLDCQVMTPHMAVLGAREIPRDEFLDRLEFERERGLRLFESTP